MKHVLHHFLRSERGQALPVICLMMVGLLGMGGIVVDIGHAYFSYRQLQASTDAAALAGAQLLSNSTASTSAVIAQAIAYSGVSNDKNALSTLPGVTMPSQPTISCRTTLQSEGMACVNASGGNAVSVTQQVSVPMYFLAVVGKKTMTLSTTATAAMRGGTPTPYNVAIVMDQTLSMNIPDNSCGANQTQMTCALGGVQLLLQSLTPCAMSLSTCTTVAGVAANSVDRVAIFAFPNVTIGTASINTNCTTPVPAPTSSNGYYNIDNQGIAYGNFTIPYDPWNGIATSLPYTFPAAGASSYTPTGSTNGTYQITPFLSDYRTSDTASGLNPNSDLVQAAGAVSGCGGMLPPNYEIVYDTYYAPALYAAQASLVSQAAQNPGSQNVMILLSDGDANAPQNYNQYGNYPVFQSPATASGTYPSWVNECTQGVVAANAATTAGTRVYSVAYGSPNGGTNGAKGCSTDAGAATITPCAAMAAIASAPQYFFSDYNQSAAVKAGVTPCKSPAQGSTSLSDIFTEIANDLTTARLIPNDTP